MLRAFDDEIPIECIINCVTKNNFETAEVFVERGSDAGVPIVQSR